MQQQGNVQVAVVKVSERLQSSAKYRYCAKTLKNCHMHLPSYSIISLVLEGSSLAQNRVFYVDGLKNVLSEQGCRKYLQAILGLLMS